MLSSRTERGAGKDPWLSCKHWMHLLPSSTPY